MTQLDPAGETERAIEIGLRILRLEPLHEPAVRRLMRLYGESGRRGAAVQLYRTLADALKTELGAQPEAATRALFAELARGGEDLTSEAHAESRGAVAADANTPQRPGMAGPSHAADKEQRLPTRSAFRLRAAPAILAGALILAIALISYRQLALTQGAVSTPLVSDISIVVLPFANLSGDAGQDFFSDGITEEITAALANIPGLRVVARTSAFQFRAQNRDIQSIGRQLHATHFIEGSVRKEGERVRVTAQLIKANEGIGLWAANYDRELKDIFTTQEDIAHAIAAALRVPLGLKEGTSLVRNRNIDPKSYEQYLHAKALLLGRRRKDAATALDTLELVVARNPDYAPAWAMLTEAYARVSNPGREAAFDPKSEAAARRAIELDPDLADGYLALAAVEGRRERWLAREDLLSKALTLDPNNQDVLNVYSNVLAAMGRLKESLAMKQQLRQLEPFVPVYNGNLADVLWVNGQNEAAIAILKDFPAGESAAGSPGGRFEIARIYAAAGRYSEAADLLLELSTLNLRPELAATAKDAARILRTAPAKAPSPQDLPRLRSAGFVYLYIGAATRALEDDEEAAETGFFSPTAIALLWHPSYAPVRKTERFKAYLRKAGLVAYWRERGWPDLCHPVGADDFACV
jgi:TolB-like protein